MYARPPPVDAPCRTGYNRHGPDLLRGVSSLRRGPDVARVIFAFNGDLESRLALHWLVHERGHQVLTLSINLGQEIYLEPLGELALELGATAAQVIDRRKTFLTDFAFPVLQADAVY